MSVVFNSFRKVQREKCDSVLLSGLSTPEDVSPVHQDSENADRTTDASYHIEVSSSLLTPDDHLLCRRLLASDFSDHKPVTNFGFLGTVMQLFKKERPGSNILQFVANGVLPIPAEKLLALNIDNAYRKTWDESSLETTSLPRENDFTEAIYSLTKYPAPLAKREHFYHRRVLQHGSGIILTCNAFAADSAAQTWKKVRVSEYQSITVIKPVNRSSANLTVLYFEDPKAPAPGFMVNWLTITALPSLLKKTMHAATNYPDNRLRSVLNQVIRVNADPMLESANLYSAPTKLLLSSGYDSLLNHLYVKP